MENSQEILAPVQMFQNEPFEPGLNKAEPGDLIYYIEKISVLVAKHGNSISATGWIVGFQCAECGSILVSYKNLKLHENECGHTATSVSEAPQTPTTKKQIETSCAINSFKDQAHNPENQHQMNKENTDLSGSPKGSFSASELNYFSEDKNEKTLKIQHLFTTSPQLVATGHNEEKICEHKFGEPGKQEIVVSGSVQQSKEKNQSLADDVHMTKLGTDITIKEENSPSENSPHDISFDEEDLSEDEVNFADITSWERDSENYHSKHTCPVCGKRFSRQSKLGEHQVKHTGEKPFECNLCGQRFAWKQSLNQHEATCTGVGDWRAGDSQNETPVFDFGLFNKRAKTYACVLCKKHFADLRWLKKHFSEQHEGNKCDKLETFADLAKDVKQEMGFTAQMVEENAAEGKQTVNKKSTETENEQQENQEDYISPTSSQKLNSDKIYKCKKCNKEFPRERFLKKHMLMHEEGNIHCCDLCGKVFCYVKALEAHKPKCKSKKKSSNKNRTCSGDTNNQTEPSPKLRVQCEECKKYFSSPGMLKRHSVVHTKEKDLTCHICSNVFTYKTFRQHLKQCKAKHGREKEIFSKIQCASCKEELSSEKDLSKHTCNGDKSKAAVEYVCGVCNRLYLHKISLKKHMKIHTMDIFKCENCGRTFTENCRYQAHIKICSLPEEQKYIYKCSNCPKAFKHRASLLDHERIHKGELLFKCDVCGKHYLTNHNLKMHIKSAHSGEKPFMCSQCGKCFPMRSNLNTHLKVHAGKQDFKCEICGKGFVFKGRLNRHMAHVHSDVRNFQCQKCPKAFKSISDLNSHEFIHTGIRPYKCTLCPMAFKTRSNLRYHEGTHSGFKQFECSVCHQKFSVRANMLKHKESHAAHSDAVKQENINSFMAKDQFLWNFPMEKI